MILFGGYFSELLWITAQHTLIMLLLLLLLLPATIAALVLSDTRDSRRMASPFKCDGCLMEEIEERTSPRSDLGSS